jgi:glutaconate CoA-transferase subunit A
VGAHPTGCPGYYLEDRERLKEYIDASESPEAFQVYLHRYVHKASTLEAYLIEAGVLGDPAPAPAG